MKIRRPRSARDKRLARLAGHLPPPPWSPGRDPIAQAHASRMAEMDLSLRAQFADASEHAEAFGATRMMGGSGLRSAELLRQLLNEYNHRLTKAGFYSLPASFNFVEAFLEFSDRFLLFDLRSERDHLLYFDDFLDWYTGLGIPASPNLLADLIEDGVVYSYDALDFTDGLAIKTDRSAVALLNLSLIRRSSDVSVVALLGESPADPEDEKIGDESTVQTYRGHENVRPNPDLIIADRYLDELPTHCRVVAFARFDIEIGAFVGRMVNVDLGNRFMVSSDDEGVLPHIGDGVSEEHVREIVAHMSHDLNKYREVFSALSVLLYLPAFFVDKDRKYQDVEVATQLDSEMSDSDLRKKVKRFAGTDLPLRRSIRCAVKMAERSVSPRRVTPPDLRHEADGYWKPVAPGHFGTDRQGNKVLNRTWVKRSNLWSERNLSEFLVQEAQVLGRDPGSIYVARSPAHATGLYKVGLTRLTADKRAKELSGATGVAQPFEVLAEWAVGDCSRVEREVHASLDEYRLNDRREFFQCPLPQILKTIERIAVAASKDEKVSD